MTSRMLPRIEPTSDALTTSCSPSSSAKKRDDQLGRVAERDVEQAADPGPERVASSSVARPISAAVGITAGGGGEEDQRRAGVVELEHDRDRDERDEQVRPALAAEQEGAQRTAGDGLRARGRDCVESAAHPGDCLMPLGVRQVGALAALAASLPACRGTGVLSCRLPALAPLVAAGARRSSRPSRPEPGRAERAAARTAAR